MPVSCFSDWEDRMMGRNVAEKSDKGKKRIE